MTPEPGTIRAILDKPLSDQLPITFQGSCFSLDELSYSCPKCEAPIPETRLLGTVTRLIESVATVTGEANCLCGEKSEFMFRIRSDATMEVLGEYGWKIFDVNGPPNLFRKILCAIKRLSGK
jgi:hypothetical protein